MTRLLALLLSFGTLSLGTLSLGTACAPAEPARLELQVGGMVCESCARGISHAVLKLDGVTACDIDWSTGRAEIRHDPARADVAAITAAITRLGYTAQPAGPAHASP